MSILKNVKDEIQLKMIFKGLKVDPCWKCKYYKFNKKITCKSNVFVCSSKKDGCKKWKERYVSSWMHWDWDREDVIEDVLDKYKIQKKVKRDPGDWRMKRG